MKKYLYLIEKMPLFCGIAREETQSMLDCLQASLKHYAKQDDIFTAGGPANRVGIVLEGSAQVVRDDVFGNRTILTGLGVGDMFGETFACANVEMLPVSVIATDACVILLLDYRKIITTCSASCSFHNRMIENMLQILAAKNLILNRKIEAVSAHSTREKLLVYLAGQSGEAGSAKFEIPFNRQALADYLSVDRSAMSAELGKMRDEGLLRFHKNQFELLHLSDRARGGN